ncbi:hypothetical protein AB0912_01420 [Streptomyces sp. NPDC007084]|uniref:hypothetical protein n=1 Tax=Streptomyces sp. NPDC007084 TaxID=3154313 RepID=UPI003455D9DC
MTSTTDKAGHPDVAEISDLTEGLLPPSRSEDVRRHLDDCALCADVYDSLEEIRGLLGTLPGPPRMPDDVAGRIDAALAAEALLSATAPDEDAGTAAPQPHVSRETSTADRPSGRPRAATGPGRPRRAKRGRRGTVALLGTAFAAAALGVSVILVQTLGDDGSDKNPPNAHRPASSAQDTFAEPTLRTEVSDLLAKNKKAATPSSGEKPWGAQSQDTETDSGGVGTFMTPTPPVPDCVEQGAGETGPLLGAKAGTYQGKDAFLLVVADPADSTKVTAHIVDATCAKQASPKPGKLLLTRSYTRS